MTSEAEYMSDLTESGEFFWEIDSSPDSIKKLIPFFGDGSLEGMDEFIVADEVGGIRIKDIKDQIGLTISDINFQIFNHLFELIQSN